MEYADVLDYYLNKMGMKQADLARALGVPRSSIGNIMKGRTKAPSIFKAKAIADALGVSLDEMTDMFIHDKRPDDFDTFHRPDAGES